MLDWLNDIRYRVWHPLPAWVKWAVVVWLLFSFDAVRMAWGERRFVGGYFEALVADFIYVGIPLLSFALGIVGGVRVYERTNSKLAGWAAGIAISFAIYLVRVGAEWVPGVGWRIERMQEAHDFASELE